MTNEHQRNSLENELAAASGGTVIVAISGSGQSEALVREARALADQRGVAWEAVHVETPQADRNSALGTHAAEALALATKLGATIVTLPAASVADGLGAYLDSSAAQYLVLGAHRESAWWHRPPTSVLDSLIARGDGLVLQVHTRGGDANHRSGKQVARATLSAPGRHYLLAAALVAATLAIAEVLQLFLGTRPLDLLFLFPVIAVAARLGLGPALLAVALSVTSYNYFLLVPVLSFNAQAPQNLVMTGVLVALAAYTSTITTRMRGRLVLSDRSALENASIAALAQKLTRDADWEATALTVCEHVQHLFKLHASIFREIDGELKIVASVPREPQLGPVDQAALDWAWSSGEEAGSGTQVLGDADWQFQPLKTSLGTLAVLAIARDDGRNPIGAGQRLLFQTLVAQSALAHERLRLEDRMRTAAQMGMSKPD